MICPMRVTSSHSIICDTRKRPPCPQEEKDYFLSSYPPRVRLNQFPSPQKMLCGGTPTIPRGGTLAACLAPCHWARGGEGTPSTNGVVETLAFGKHRIENKFPINISSLTVWTLMRINCTRMSYENRLNIRGYGWVSVNDFLK